MRIWTIHPKYLDVKGFVALWRETLLAQNALLGNTRGWFNHPQLNPFKMQKDPVRHLANYLHLLCDEAEAREYTFVKTKILFPFDHNLPKIPTTQEVLDKEWQILLGRYPARSPKWFEKVKHIKSVTAHDSFIIE